MKRWLFILEAFPVQYHAPVYRALAKMGKNAASGADLRVFYASDATLRGKYDTGFGRTIAWDEPLLEGYASCLVSGWSGWKIPWILYCDRPTAVLLTQFNHSLSWVAYISCLFLRIPLWIRTETQDEAFARSPVKERVRRMFYVLLYAAVDHCFAIGKANRNHYLRHAVEAKRITYSRYCVTDRFAEITPEGQRQLRNKIRRELGFDQGRLVLLFCGKLQRKKNPGCILEALCLLSPLERQSFAVLFVGSGEEENDLCDQARIMTDIPIRFVGFKNQSELVPYYLASDVLILPSRQMGETWGLVVNEALLANLQVIVSPYVGCLADFAELPSVTTFNGTATGLVRALIELPPSTTAAGNRVFMGGYSVRQAAEGIWNQLAGRFDRETCA